jgi:hypothetical protein
MKVALRDDDTSYFTEPERLESVYHDVWNRIPVGLAVVPHAAGFVDKAVPEKYWDAGRAFPLEENAALVKALRGHINAGRVTISIFPTATSSRRPLISKAASRAGRHTSKAC